MELGDAARISDPFSGGAAPEGSLWQLVQRLKWVSRLFHGVRPQDRTEPMSTRRRDAARHSACTQSRCKDLPGSFSLRSLQMTWAIEAAWISSQENVVQDLVLCHAAERVLRSSDLQNPLRYPNRANGMNQDTPRQCCWVFHTIMILRNQGFV